jgi:hypothetical protein
MRTRKVRPGPLGLSLLLSVALAGSALAQSKGKSKGKKPPPATKPVEEPLPEVVLPPPDLSKMADNVSVMALEGNLPDKQALSERLQVEVQKQVRLPVEPRSSLGSIALTVGCGKVDALCLGNVGAVVGSQYLVYGAAKEKAGKVALELRFFDAKASRELGAVEAELPSAADLSGLPGLVTQLLAGAPDLKPKPVDPEVVVKKPPLYGRPSFWGVVAGVLGGGVVLFVATDRAPRPADPGELGVVKIQF